MQGSQEGNPLVYIWAPRTAFKWPPRWEPWDNNCLSPLHVSLEQDPLGRGEPLSVEHKLPLACTDWDTAQPMSQLAMYLALEQRQPTRLLAALSMPSWRFSGKNLSG
ncbi:uncharacterized protein VP01_3919g2 [Puccinia sorghi]|uniref:Uncharacterized protein n=1 Tax=Puccinia sorghi TaxID=27349 RepID=A0A0L6USK4_9BASI|nr:uncharacterized protein VP01_3919g2 [Puccinia sorghi]